jgi:hypothetical protein
MRKSKPSTAVLVKLFYQHQVLQLDAIKIALGTSVKMTIFRKLKTMGYRSSYSHAGKYYTLDEIARYNSDGLWSFGKIHFSKFGNLLNTIEALVASSSSGYWATELNQLLQVRVYDSLSILFKKKRLFRQQLGGEFLYLSPLNHTLQFDNRQQQLESAAAATLAPQTAPFATAAVRTALNVLLSVLNEKQRRLYVGFESLKIGYGGDTLMAKITGMNIKTVARGRHELQAPQITPERVRQVGGGRPPLEKKRPF